ncbi:MAG: sulfite exporter TauE/SafE family protein [Xanthobacteraceae bacterium]
MLAIAGLAFVLAGFVKGVIGMGLPTIAVGLLSVVMSPAEAVALMLVPSLVTNIWQALAGANFNSLLRRLWPVLLGICIGAWLASRIGIWLLTPDAASDARRVLGVTLMIYAAVGLANVPFSIAAPTERWLGPLTGVATGLVSAATGVFMFPAVPFYQAIGLAKDEQVQAQGVSYTVSTLALAVLLATSGGLHIENAAVSLLAVLPALAGMAVGQFVLKRVRPQIFRICFYVGMLGLGAHLAFFSH